MRVICLQHVPYEPADAIADWAKDRGHDFTAIVPLLEQFPDPDTFDMLVVMGGPMGAYEDESNPWLVTEKAFIRRAIDSDRLVFGVCLGAQLVACALGGSAHPHTERELGWLPVRLTDVGLRSRVLSVMPAEMVVGLWHGDTYDLPEGLHTGAVSDGCPNQAFEACGGRVVGTQFHLEWKPDTLQRLAEAHPDWLERLGAHVRSREEFLNPGHALEQGHRVLYAMLDAMGELL